LSSRQPTELAFRCSDVTTSLPFVNNDRRSQTDKRCMRELLDVKLQADDVLHG